MALPKLNSPGPRGLFIQCWHDITNHIGKSGQILKWVNLSSAFMRRPPTQQADFEPVWCRWTPRNAPWVVRAHPIYPIGWQLPGDRKGNPATSRSCFMLPSRKRTTSRSLQKAFRQLSEHRSSSTSKTLWSWEWRKGRTAPCSLMAAFFKHSKRPWTFKPARG